VPINLGVVIILLKYSTQNFADIPLSIRRNSANYKKENLFKYNGIYVKSIVECVRTAEVQMKLAS